MGRVAEAGVLVLLVARIEADGEALGHELEAGEDGHAVHDPAERLARRQGGEDARRSCRFAGLPLVGETVEVGDELGRDQVEIGAAAVVVALAGEVVGGRPVARTVGVEVLAPEQELDGVPAGRHLVLVADLVAADDRVDRHRRRRVVDEAGVGLALDIVDERLVERPGVDAALDRLDRAVIEAERLGDEIGRPRRDPGTAGRGKSRVGGVGEERL